MSESKKAKATKSNSWSTPKKTSTSKTSPPVDGLIDRDLKGLIDDLREKSGRRRTIRKELEELEKRKAELTKEKTKADGELSQANTKLVNHILGGQ